MFKSDVRRFQCDGPIGAATYILGKSAASPTEYFITWFVLGDILADRFNCPGKINTQSCVFWFAQTNTHCAHDFGRAFDKVPIVWINRSCANSDQDLIVGWRRLFNLFELEVAQAIVAINHRFHGISWRRSFSIALIGRGPVGGLKPDHQREKN